MNLDPTLASNRIVQTLINGQEADRYEAKRIVKEEPETLDLEELRRQLLNQLKNFAPDVDEEEEPNILARSTDAYTRSWLVTVLGLICEDDPKAKKVVRRHLDPDYEPDNSIRGWTLASLIEAGASDIVTLARQMLKSESETHWGYQLALAVLAANSPDSKEKKGYLKKVREGLDKKSDPAIRRNLARATGFAHIPTAVPPLCEMVELGEFSEITYEAIIALSKTPKDSRSVDEIARSLTAFISKYRRSSRRDDMRIKALAALGDFKVASTAPVLIEELSDNNPAIIRQAAKSLETVLTTPIAVDRVIEAAVIAGPEGAKKYASALRWMDRNVTVEVLEDKMIAGPYEKQEMARQLLSEIGGAIAFQKLRAQTTVMENYQEVLQEAEKKVRDLFESSIKEARSGFRLATTMDTIVFAVGVFLIGISAWMVLQQEGRLDDWVGVGVTGSTGVLGIIYGILIAKPRKQVTESVDHLMYLKVVFLGYLRQLHQVDQAYTRRLLERDALTPDEVGKFSGMIGTTIESAITQLSTNARRSGSEDKPGNFDLPGEVIGKLPHANGSETSQVEKT